MGLKLQLPKEAAADTDAELRLIIEGKEYQAELTDPGVTCRLRKGGTRTWYEVGNGRCSCPGFASRGYCLHLRSARERNMAR